MKRALPDAQRNFEEALRSSASFPFPVKSAAPEALQKLLARYFGEQENRNGPGVTPKVEVKEVAERTVRRLTLAVRHAKEHPDANIRTAAKKLIRFVQKARTFSDLAQSATRFRGLQNKVGHRREELKRQAACEELPIGAGGKLVELTSDQLVSFGKKHGYCVAHPRAYPWYFEALRKGKARFFALVCDGTERGLLEVDCLRGQLVEAQGPYNAELKLKRKEALAILRALPPAISVSTDIEAFTRVGAFDEFRKGTSLAINVRHRGSEYRVWCQPDGANCSVILSRKRGKKRKKRAAYSRFLLRGRSVVEGCCHRGAMDAGEFTALMLDCRPLYDFVRGARLKAVRRGALRNRR